MKGWLQGFLPPLGPVLFFSHIAAAKAAPVSFPAPKSNGFSNLNTLGPGGPLNNRHRKELSS